MAELDVDFRAVTPDGTTAVTSTTPGSVLRFDLTLTNRGLVPYTDILVTTDATEALDDVVTNGDQTASSGELVIDGHRASGGPATSRSAAASSSPARSPCGRPRPGRPDDHRHAPSRPRLGSNCPPGTTASHCARGDPGAAARVDPGQVEHATPTAVAGQTVGYTVTATNTGETDQVGITVQDLLADVLDDATYNNDAVAQVTPPGPGPTGPPDRSASTARR